MNTYIKLLSCSLLMLTAACDQMEILPPPTMITDPSDDNTPSEGTQSGTGKSEVLSVLFVDNETTASFISDDSYPTFVVTDYASTYFNDENFARVTDEVNAPSTLALDILPTLIMDEFMTLQAAEHGMETTTYPGAFGTTVQDEWHANSNWWVLEPQDINYGYDANNVTIISGAITENTTWTNDQKYLLDGQVFVRDGATLTIEPGTIIFGAKGTGVESGVLCINRGAKLEANGTPELPIVFTGTLEAGSRTRGQWGGIVFLGHGITNKGEDVLIEGISGTDNEDGLYGGSNNDDYSGSMSYVRVEYAGVAVGTGNELNSITFASVGTQTSIHHIIVSYAGDDAYEWFGGEVALKYAVSYNCLDDDMDMDAGYAGQVQFVYIVRQPFAADESGSSCFEVSSSNSEGTLPQTSATISNATIVGPYHSLALTEDLVMDPKFRGGLYSTKDAAVTLQNSVIVGCPVGVENP